MPSKETMYIAQHTGELARKYKGSYIAVFKDKVIASGKTISEVYKIADELKIKKPLVTYVPKKGEELLLV